MAEGARAEVALGDSARPKGTARAYARLCPGLKRAQPGLKKGICPLKRRTSDVLPKLELPGDDDDDAGKALGGSTGGRRQCACLRARLLYVEGRGETKIQ